MDAVKYKSILTDVGVEINEHDNSNWKPLFRQCLIASGVCCVYFLQGLFLGAPTVLVAQIRADKNSTEVISDETLSWLATFPIVGAVPSMFILPIIFNRIGRKLTYIFVCLSAIISFIIFYTSTNLHHILISAAFIGPPLGSASTIAPVMLAEYTSPKYRGVFLTLKSATAFWGIWVSNAIGTFFHWKNIAIAALVCSVYLVSVLAWPESPYWLAKRGRFIESAKSHRWLKGVNEDSEKQLAQLFHSLKNVNKTRLSSSSKNGCGSCRSLSRFLSMITSPPFYKPVLCCILLLTQYHCTGKFILTMYAIQVLKHITPDQSFIYKSMLILDGITVFSMYMGCVISRYFKRKTLLLFFSGSGISVLYVLSAYLYLSSMSVIVRNDVVVLVLLSIFSIVIGCGPIILCTSIFGEIMPLRYQKAAMMFVGVGGVIIIAILLKLSPFMFKYFKMQGCFLFYAISSSVLLAILIVYLPETKNKSVQEIEQHFAKNPAFLEENKTIHKERELNRLM